MRWFLGICGINDAACTAFQTKQNFAGQDALAGNGGQQLGSGGSALLVQGGSHEKLRSRL